jgi:hypothetical protein
MGAAHTFASRARLRALAAGPLVALVLLTAGCGSDNSDDVTIPKTNADQLLGALDQVQSACQSQQRDEAVSAAEEFHTLVDALPKEVGEEAKSALFDAADNLKKLAAKCEEPAGPSDTFTSTSEATTTTSTSTSTRTSTSTSTTAPPDQNQGEGNGVPSGGNGGGQGGGGGETDGTGNGGSGGIGGGKAG